MLVTPYVTCNDTCVWFHIDTQLPGGSVRYGVSRDKVEEGSRARKRNLGMRVEEEEGEASRMQSWADRGTGVRCLKQHLYALLLTLTSSHLRDIIYFFDEHKMCTHRCERYLMSVYTCLEMFDSLVAQIFFVENSN